MPTYKLKSGSHVYKDADGNNIVVEPGGTATTDIDLRKKEGRDRWDLVDAQGTETIEDLKARIRILEGMSKPPAKDEEPTAEDDGLDTKSIKQLREVAAEMSPPVDLSGITTKEAIITAIRNAVDNA
jgi:hypothetical protein